MVLFFDFFGFCGREMVFRFFRRQGEVLLFSFFVSEQDRKYGFLIFFIFLFFLRLSLCLVLEAKFAP